MSFCCIFCGKEIDESKIMPHLNNKCKLAPEKKFIDTYSVFKSKEIVNEIIDLYVNEEYSIDELFKKHRISKTALIAIIQEAGYPIRTIKDSAKTSRRLKKSVNACLERFGVENASQAEEIKDKKAATFLENYGVDNIWKSDEFKKNHLEYMFTTYGKGSLANRYGNHTGWFERLSNEEKEKFREARSYYSRLQWETMPDAEREERIGTFIKAGMKAAGNFSSKFEDKLACIFKDNNLNFSRQFFLSRKSYDFLFPEEKIILEAQGDFWHANPKLFEANDVMNFPAGNRPIAQEIWDKDLEKKMLAESAGYKVIYLWESEIKGLTDKEIMDIIEQRKGE